MSELQKLHWLVFKTFLENWESIVELMFDVLRKLPAALGTDWAKKVMTGDEEISKHFFLQVFHKILKQKLEAVMKICELPVVVISSHSAGM